MAWIQLQYLNIKLHSGLGTNCTDLDPYQQPIFLIASPKITSKVIR